MLKLEETNLLIDTLTGMTKEGIESRNMNQAILLDIAKSLAMIADKLCEQEPYDCGANMKMIFKE